MTRLITADIADIPKIIASYDQELIFKTGASLEQIARSASGFKGDRSSLVNQRVAVIPITAGLGAIDGFAEALNSIAGHLGFNVFITGNTDVRGLAEAYECGASIGLLADDNMFAAVNFFTRKVINNDEATARGYVAALKYMAGDIAGMPVMLAGAGRLGTCAAEILAKAGTDLILYDLDRKKEEKLACSLVSKYGTDVQYGLSLEETLGKCEAIFDASPGDAFITSKLLKKRLFVAAPGMPLGLDLEAYNLVADQAVHDPLQIGAATMLFSSIKVAL